MPGKGFLPARGGDPLPLCGAGQSVLHFFAEARFPFGSDEVLAVSKELQHVALPVGDDESATGHGLENTRARLVDGESPLRIPIVRRQDDPGGAVDLSPGGRLRVSAFHAGTQRRVLAEPLPPRSPDGEVKARKPLEEGFAHRIVRPHECDVVAVLHALPLRQGLREVNRRITGHGEPASPADARSIKNFNGLRPLAEDPLEERSNPEDRIELSRRIRRPERGHDPGLSNVSDRRGLDPVPSRDDEEIGPHLLGTSGHSDIQPLPVEVIQPGDPLSQASWNDAPPDVEDVQFVSQRRDRPLDVLRNGLVVRVVIPDDQDFHRFPTFLLAERRACGFSGFASRERARIHALARR
jgi:hypothetical protein